MIISKVRPKYFLYNISENIVKNRNIGQFRRTQLVSVVPNDGLSETREILCGNKDAKFSDTDFKSIRTNLIEKFRHINEINVDAVIVGLCNTTDHLSTAKSYIQFLKKEGFDINNAIWGKLLRLYYITHKNNILTESDKTDILDIYDNIICKHTVLDPTTCEQLILGLVTTNQWQKSLDLLEMIKLTSVPNVVTYSVVAARAFQEREYYKIGWNLLTEIIQNKKQPRCEVFIEYFKSIANCKDEFTNNLENMLNFIGVNEIIISREVIEHLQEILREFNIKSSVSNLTKIGKCSSCGTFLERISISNKEFKALRSSFLDKVLIRNDIFLKSSPKEIEQFLKYIDDTGPFHCIVDGLNVAYSCGTKKNNLVYAKLVSSVVKYFVNKNMNILILGRKHMNQWPHDQLSYIKRNAKLFLTNNLSQDDPFLLYAALKSGPTTDFFSRDLMRSHSFLLGQELKSIFKKWQQEHQYSLINAKENGEIIVKGPIKYNVNAHKVNGYWHIPFRDQYVTNPKELYEFSNRCLCFAL